MSEDGAHTNVTPEPTAFVARQSELAALREMSEESRLVTITGPPGVGKTRLAVEYALEQVSDDIEGGVWFCDLADCESSEDVATVVARVFDVPLSDAPDSIDSVADALAARGPSLVVLDNFEQVVEHGPETVGRWTDICPETRFVVTSRETLRLRGERRLELQPLGSESATQLFTERARAVVHDFEASDDDVLGTLVQRLDGLALAIELAAARVSALAPAEILARLDDRFRLLRSAHRDRNPRQATLHAAIDWSWQLLDPPEKDALAQLSVFRESFTLSDAEAVVEPLDDAWTPDVVESLRDKSLLRADQAGEGLRFRMYESVRDFVETRDLDLDDARRRHAEHFARRGRDVVSELNGEKGREKLGWLRASRANLGAAFERFRGVDTELALDVAAVLDALMKLVGPPARHRELLDDAVALSEETSPSRRADMLGRRGTFAALQSRFEHAAEDLDAAIELSRGDDLDDQLPWLLVRRGDVHRLTGDHVAAVETFEEAREATNDQKLQRIALGYEANCWIDLGDWEKARECVDDVQRLPESDDLRRECELLRRLAYVQFYLENVQEQRRLNERALEFARRLGDRRLEGVCLQGVGDCAMSAGEFEDAIDAYRKALEIHQELANRTWEAILLGNLGGALHRLERFDDARRRYSRSLEYHRVAGIRPYEGVVLFAIGTLEFEQGHYDEARNRFEGAVELARELQNQSDEAGLRLCLAWTDIVEGRYAEAIPHAEAAEELFEELGEEDIGWVAVSLATQAVARAIRGDAFEDRLQRATDIAATRGIDSQATIVALLGALIETLDDDSSAAQLAARRREIRDEYWKPDADRPVVKTSLHARIVDTLVSRFRSTEAAGDSSETAGAVAAPLVVGPEANWFEADDERVDLRRRKSIRLILNHLVNQHEEDPGGGTDVHDLFDIGWPGETIDPEPAARRVYWAIRTLRKNGLEDVLITSDDGYLLDPDVVIARAKE